MNLGQITALTRTQLATLGLGELAVDFIIVPYINDGYRRFVSETGNIDDVVTVDVVAGESEVQIPQHVLKVKRVKLGGKALDIVNRPDLERASMSDEAEPKLFVLGDSRYVGSIHGTPKVSGELTMWVQRGVIEELSGDTDVPTDMEPDYHMALVDFAVGALLRTQPGDMNRVSLIRDRSGDFVNAILSCKSRRERQRSKPARVVAYGGI